MWFAWAQDSVRRTSPDEHQIKGPACQYLRMRVPGTLEQRPGQPPPYSWSCSQARGQQPLPLCGQASRPHRNVHHLGFVSNFGFLGLQRSPAKGQPLGAVPSARHEIIACEDGLLHTRIQMACVRRRHDAPSVGNPFASTVIIKGFAYLHSPPDLRGNLDRARLQRRTPWRLTPARLRSTVTPSGCSLRRCSW